MNGTANGIFVGLFSALVVMIVAVWQSSQSGLDAVNKALIEDRSRMATSVEAEAKARAREIDRERQDRTAEIAKERAGRTAEMNLERLARIRDFVAAEKLSLERHIGSDEATTREVGALRDLVKDGRKEVQDQLRRLENIPDEIARGAFRKLGENGYRPSRNDVPARRYGNDD